MAVAPQANAGLAPYNGGIDPSQSVGGVLGSVGLSDPSTGLPTTGDTPGRPAPTLSTNPLGAVQDIGRPTVESRQMRLADQDYDDLQAKRDAYAQPAHGVLGHISHFLRPSLAFETDPIRARIAQDEQGLREQGQLNNVANKQLDENAEKATPEYQAKQAADLAHTQAETKELGAPKSEFELWQQQNPNGTPLQYHQAMVAPQSQASATRRTQQWAPALKKLGLPEDLFSSPDMTEADAADAEKQLKTQLTDANNTDKIAAATQRAAAAQGNIGTWSLQNSTQPDGTTKTVLLNSKTGAVKDAPAGIVKPGAHASADEQKRADLSANLLENLNQLDDVVKRRPELFGMVNGRLTQVKGFFGSSDPDVAALYNIQHQLGIVAQSSHGMRSAQGIEGSANALINNFHNSPEAMTGAIKSARNSANVFIHQADHPGESRAPQASGSAPGVGEVRQGYRFKGGDQYDKNNWEKVAN